MAATTRAPRRPISACRPRRRAHSRRPRRTPTRRPRRPRPTRRRRPSGSRSRLRPRAPRRHRHAERRAGPAHQHACADAPPAPRPAGRAERAGARWRRRPDAARSAQAPSASAAAACAPRLTSPRRRLRLEPPAPRPPRSAGGAARPRHHERGRRAARAGARGRARGCAPDCACPAPRRARPVRAARMMRRFCSSFSALDAQTSNTASTREAVTLACWPPGPRRAARAQLDLGERDGHPAADSQRVVHGRQPSDSP